MINNDWCNSYSEKDKDLLNQYEELVQKDLTKEYFDKLEKLSFNKESEYIDSIIKNIDFTEDDSDMLYYVELPFRNLNIYLKPATFDAKIQLKFLFLKRYLSQCIDLDKQKCLGLVYFNIYAKKKIYTIFVEIIKYLNETIDEFSDKEEFSVTSCFDNTADMFVDLLDLMSKFDYAIDYNPPFEMSMDNIWNKFINEKYKD